MIRTNSPLAIVAHDAGAANHIFAWFGHEQARFCLAGPAYRLWHDCAHRAKQVVPELLLDQNSPELARPELCLTAAMRGAATLVTGTGWGSSLEHSARKLARDHCIRSIAVVDHWTNYSERFVRDGEQVLPDEIWVTDPYAADIARREFPSVRITQQPNTYLSGLVTDIKSLEHPSRAKGNDRVLYVLEPIRKAWGDLTEPGEFLALNYFMAHLDGTPITRFAEIRLRPHPSDPPGKYNDWIKRHGSNGVSLDQSETLAQAIAWSNIVVGCQTYAMVIALACGKRVFSTIPPWAPACTLPHERIEKFASFNKCH
jgi:hypothetical protein